VRVKNLRCPKKFLTVLAVAALLTMGLPGPEGAGSTALGSSSAISLALPQQEQPPWSFSQPEGKPKLSSKSKQDTKNDIEGMERASINGGAAITERGVPAERGSALGDSLALASVVEGPQLCSDELPDFIEGMDPATINGGAAGTDQEVSAKVASLLREILALASMAQGPQCGPGPSEFPPEAPPRPLWTELQPPTGATQGAPDYVNVTNNFQVVNTIRLLASIATRAAQKLQDLSSQVEDPEAVGRCVCSPSDIHQNVKRKDCTTTVCPSTQSPYPLWLPTDLFKDTSNTLLFALKLIGFLDKIKEILDAIQNSSGGSALLQALQTLQTTLENLNELIQKYQKYVDLLTEGYHLGGYSTERPDLHLCVGYGGHGAFAQMLKLFGEVSIGSRYTSHNLSKEHRAQFRSGGFAVDAFGHTLSIFPGIEANLQIDGFKLWDAQKPFGIDLGQLGQQCIPINDIDKYDIFHLVEANDITCKKNNQTVTGLTCFDSNNNGCIEPGEFVIKDFYKATYKSGANTYTWPRPGFEQFDWERQNTAVFGAGLNLPLKLKRIEKNIPPSGIVLFPGATLFPKLTLDAGAEWKHKANDLRDRLKDAINKNLPTNLQLTADDFERPMHALQAPDVSADDTSSAFVQPRIAADLVLGIALSKFLTLGITATIGTSVRVEPQGHGGLHDLNVALTEALLHSNPPPDLPCDPIIEKKETKRCSNELFLDNKGEPLSSGKYSCETTEPIRYHCKEPEQDRTCKPETAEQDCPKTKECVAERGCSAYGYCTREVEVGVKQVEHDTTLAACEGRKVCQRPATNAGQECNQDSDCPGPKMCVGGTNNGHPCSTNADCPRGECQSTTAPCMALAPGDFTPYQCLIGTQAEITGWQGPGCHPLTVGFPSVVACQSDTDCVDGLEKCVDGACHSLSDNQPVPSDCDPGNPMCTSGRTCVEGACMLVCASDADCAANQTCNNGVCVNPYGIPFAEQLVWQVSHTPKPQHAVDSYALSDILASAILDAGLWIGLELKIFKKTYHFDVLKISDAWVLAAFNKSWYQAGLEARYQNDCDPVPNPLVDNTVTNWQPANDRVNRYPTSLPGTGSFGNAGTEAGLLQWCLDKLPNDVANPDAPDEDDLANAVTDIVNWGEDIGVDIWGVSGLCVRTEGAGGVTEQPFTEWVSNLNTSPANLMCRYTYNNQTYTFPCSDLRKQLLLIWGCLDVTANPYASILAGAFPSIVTTFQNRLVLNLDAMLIDPTEEFTLDNLKPQIRNYLSPLHVGALWYSAVSQCWDARYAQVQPGDIQLLGVDVHPCCGNGKLETSGCSQGPGGTPCEQCDDGNTVAGDGCSPLCRIEGPPKPLGCGDGIVQIGLGEQCDDGNNVPGDGCEPDCTLTPKGATGTLCVLKFNDLNGNGVQDPGESLLPGWTFNVTDQNNNPVGTLTTTPPGTAPACLTVAAPATLTVTEQVQSGWMPTTPNPQTVTVQPGQTVNVTFGNKRPCDLQITKTVNPNPVQSGQQVTITLTVTNVGGMCPREPVIGYIVQDPKPAGLTFNSPPGPPVQSGGSANWRCGLDPNGNLSCFTLLDPLPSGYSATFTFTATVTAPPGSQIQNCGTVNGLNDPLNPANPGNNQSCVTLQVSGCTPAPSGMAAWWPLDETSGTTAADIAGFPNNGTHVNGPTPTPGMVGGALRFDGVNDQVRAADHAELDVGTGNFTLDAWVRTQASSGVVVLVDKRSGPTPLGYSLFLANGRLGFQMANGVGSSICAPTPTSGVACVNYVATAPNVADGQWHHVAAVVDRANATSGVRLYVDGVQVFAGAPLTGNLDNASDLYLGVRTPAQQGGGFFPGDLDEVELIKRALTQAEVQAISKAGRFGKCK
jgi:uncharacterized repeat protein (TIGR01451 family)